MKKICPKCKIEYPDTFEFFHRNGQKTQSYCKKCKTVSRTVLNKVPDLSGEIWKDINEFIGYYQISNYGRIKSLSRMIHNGKGYFLSEEKILSPVLDSSGHCQVHLHNDTGRKTLLVHRLVGAAFLPNPLNLPQINHIDGNPENNHLNNLEWCDNSHNQKHAFALGLQCNMGQNHPKTNFVDTDILEIRKLRKLGTKNKDIAEMYGVCPSTISAITRSVNWSHI
jgi:hypothetical protein